MMMPWNPRWIRSGSLRTIVPITGLLGGLLLGTAWAKLRGSPIEEGIIEAAQVGFVGSVLGMTLVLADGVGRDESGRFSIRGWMIIAAITGLSCALLASLFRG
ncbi:MAG: hypothetical protein U0800_22300 [Isosphaeraceae bacterium]